jgi:hypothetical protein
MWRGVLPAAFARAFPPSATVDLILENDIKDNYRQYLKGKTNRARDVLGSQVVDPTWPVVSWVAEPIDHLLQRLQYKDERGDSLLSLCGRDSPLSECLRAMTCSLTEPIQDQHLPTFHPISMLWQ